MKTVVIKVSIKKYLEIKGLFAACNDTPTYYDYENILGRSIALKILSLTFHEIPVQIIPFKGKKGFKIK